MHSSIYLCTFCLFFVFLFRLLNRCYFKCYPPSPCSNCRTSSNRVNNNRSRVSSVSLYLFVTSCDPPPQLTHSFIHPSPEGALLLLWFIIFFFLSVDHFDLTHAASSAVAAAAAAPPFRLAVDARRANLSRKTRDFVAHNSL